MFGMKQKLGAVYEQDSLCELYSAWKYVDVFSFPPT